MKILIKEKKNELAGSQESLNFKEEKKRIYKSKISDIPTPGYTGHQSTYTSPIGYLNKGKILNEIKEKEDEEFIKLQDKDKETTAGYYNRNKQFESEDLEELPYIVGYGGYRMGVKPRNFYSQNFQESSIKARKEILSD